jgi:hypothetical protein
MARNDMRPNLIGYRLVVCDLHREQSLTDEVSAPSRYPLRPLQCTRLPDGT